MAGPAPTLASCCTSVSRRELRDHPAGHYAPQARRYAPDSSALAHHDQFDFVKGLEVFEIGFIWPANPSWPPGAGPLQNPLRARPVRGGALVESMQGDLAWGRPSGMCEDGAVRLLTLLQVMARDSLDLGAAA